MRTRKLKLGIVFRLMLVGFLINIGIAGANPISVVIQTPDGSRDVCQGPSTFILSAVATGGSMNFVNFVWSGPPGSIIPVGDYAIFNNSMAAAPGTYNIGVTVFDDEGTSGSATITITLLETPVVTTSAGGPTNFCLGGSVLLSGSITSGLTFNWRWNMVDIPGANQPTFSASQSGIYRLRVTSGEGCSSLSNGISVTVHDLPIATASSNSPLCEGSTLELYGGPSGMLTYSWSSPTNPMFTSTDQNPLIPGITPAVAGNYILVVTDGNNCQGTAAVRVDVDAIPTPPTTASASRTQICTGATGNLTLTATGGSGQVLRWYSGSCGGVLVGTGNNLVIPFPVSTTTYYASWESGTCGQSACASVTVQVEDPPILQIVTSPISCTGFNDGEATVLISGGFPPYSISWTTGATTPSIINLIAGTYTVTVTDAAGCRSTASITLTDPIPLTANFINLINPICVGSSTGSATVQASGGTPPYSFLWGNGQTTATASGLPAGTHQVVVTDDNGCNLTASVTLSDPIPIVINATTLVHVATYGMSTGQLTVEAVNGTAPYTYVWAHGPTGPALTNLPAGFYTVTVTDANGCRAVATFEIRQPPPIIITVTGGTGRICYPANRVPDSDFTQLSTVVTGGSGAFTYLWSSVPADLSLVGQTNIANPRVSPLVTTTYNLVVEDVAAPGIQYFASITITVSNQVFAFPGASSTICHPLNGGSQILGASPPASGGSGVFTYLWSSAPTDASLVGQATNPNPLVAPNQTTTYTLTVTDSEGCVQTGQITITVRPALDVAINPTNPIICNPLNNGEVLLQAVVSGGTGPFVYSWSPATGLSNPAVSNPIASPSVTTIYTVTVTDANGCTDLATTTITVSSALNANAGPDRTVCNRQTVVLGGTPAATGGSGAGFTYLWTPAAGLSNPTLPNPTLMATTTQIFTLQVTDSQGCIATDQVTITVNPVVLADAGPDIGLCIGTSAIIGPGAVAPLRSYAWTSAPPDPSISNPNIANPTVSPSISTLYFLTVTDLTTGCTNRDTVRVTVQANPSVVIIPNSVICSGQSINIGNPLDPPGLIYTWWSSPPGFLSTLANPTVSPTTTTTYFVRVLNAFGCEATGQVTITVNPLPVAVVANDTVFCSVAQIVPIAIGGPTVANHTYSWTSNPPGFTASIANPNVTFSGTTPIVYHLVVTNQFNCTARDSVRISLSDLVLDASDPLVCQAVGQINLGNEVSVTGGVGPFVYQWFDHLNNLLFTGQNFVAQPPYLPFYQVRVTDNNLCSATENITIQFLPEPLVDLVINPPGRVYLGQIVTFSAFPSDLSNYDFFVDGVLVQSGALNSFSSKDLTHGQEIYVVATTAFGCLVISNTVILNISPLPNAFTPDGDGINDLFGEGVHLTIFNRWGLLVYEGTTGWDGTHKGRNVSPGTYYYIWRPDGVVDQESAFRGSVTVIRNRN
ncbi:MAG TPA: gliding motility-associated C-terminal domain-containing protein [Bacteroidales bacterium]|nr:gliding motility-associated C-terminal domain-containing protein [Bacteroidales bacterium]